MNKLLLSTLILSFALGTHASAAPDIALSTPSIAGPASATQMAASDLRMRPVAGQPASVQLVGLGENRTARTPSRSANDPRDGQSPAEGLPSTPIALATLLLLLCRLIGRRNS